jgi:hypothetical protein
MVRAKQLFSIFLIVCLLTVMLLIVINLDNNLVKESFLDEFKSYKLNSKHFKESESYSLDFITKGTKYYFSTEGSDANSGTDPTSPFFSFKMIYMLDLVPGDQILLRRDVFHEQMKPQEIFIPQEIFPIL